jgi:hypothetical protein
MKKLKQIDLVLENCEVISVLGENIENIYTDTIEETLFIQNQDAYLNHFVNYCYICMKKNDNTFIYSNEAVKNERSAYDRLNIRDITHIDIIYEDGTNLYFAVPWRGFNYFFNPLEKWTEKENSYIIQWSNYSIFKRLKEKLVLFYHNIYSYFERKRRDKLVKREAMICNCEECSKEHSTK